MLRRGMLLLVSMTLALCCGVPAAMAWSNGPPAGGKDGYGYGTHDWILEHAIVLAGSPAWIDTDTALYHSNDPDYAVAHPGTSICDPSIVDWHVFRDSGKSRGGPQAAADYYYEAVQALSKGATETASEKLGIMSHYYSDMLVPFHTTYDALKHENEHLAYELDVDVHTHQYSDNRGWLVQAPRVAVTDIRALAIRAAYYSRSRYPTLRDRYESGSHLGDAKVDSITREVLSRSINDLADIIRSMPTSSAISYPPKEMTASISKHYPGPGRKICAYAECLDSSGKPLEGIRVDFHWPKVGGGTTKLTAYSDVHGIAHNWFTVPSGLPLMQGYTVKLSSSSGGASIADSTWFMVTPPLADGADGIKTSVSDHTPNQNTVVKVSTVVHDTDGHAVAGLPCTFSWAFKHGTVSYTTVTGPGGVATMSKNIGRATQGYRVFVRAQVISDSTHRSSTSSFVPHTRTSA